MDQMNIGMQEYAAIPASGMQDKPYFCPNCRSNRVKFSMITTYTRPFMKDAVTGMVAEVENEHQMAEPEPNIQCRVCGFVGNEMRFVKQAEREPRTPTPTR